MRAHSILIFGILGGCGTGSVGEDVGRVGGDYTDFIVGGAPTSEYPDVGFLASPGEPTMFCSGTLIAPNKVVTAKHCVTDPTKRNGMTFSTGSSQSDPGRQDYTVTSIAPYSDGDLAVLTLDRNTPSAGVPLLGRPVRPGETVEAVGFGNTMPGMGLGQKMRADITVAEAREEEWDYSEADRGTCGGDSGGPAFVREGGRLYLAGVTQQDRTFMSGSADRCVMGTFARVDRPEHHDFLNNSVGSSPEASCGGEGESCSNGGTGFACCYPHACRYANGMNGVTRCENTTAGGSCTPAGQVCNLDSDCCIGSLCLFREGSTTVRACKESDPALDCGVDGETCTDDSECCANDCGEGGFCVGSLGTTCLPLGWACSTNLQCCAVPGSTAYCAGASSSSGGVCTTGATTTPGAPGGTGAPCTSAGQCASNHCAFDSFGDGRCEEPGATAPVTPVCRSNGESCGGAAECCSGLCMIRDGVQSCQDPSTAPICSNNGAFCSSSADCCSNSCMVDAFGDRRCQAGGGVCRGPLEVCALNSQCCSGSCQIGPSGTGSCSSGTGPTGPGCGSSGNSCSSHGQCCSGFCSFGPFGDGICAESSGPTGPSCKADGESCSSAGQCCTSNCSFGPFGDGVCGGSTGPTGPTGPSCRSDGQSCSSNGQCCTGQCSFGAFGDGTCGSSAPPGEPPRPSDPPSDPEPSDPPTSPSCKSAGQSCSSAGQCCSNHCAFDDFGDGTCS